MQNLKMIFSIIFSLSLTFSGLSQGFEVLKLDENISIPTTHDFRTVNKNNVTVTVGQIENCKTTTAKNFLDYDIKNSEDLISFYDGYQDKNIENKNGILIEAKTDTIKNLLCRTYSFYETKENERYIQHCILLFINKTLYAIYFSELESEHEKVKTIREDYFSKIEPASGINFNNQIQTDNTAYNVGYFLGTLFFYLLAALPFLLVLIWFLRKRNKKNKHS